MIVTRDEWIKALRSGDYAKGKGVLCDVDNNMCCLGVLADLIDHDAWGKIIGTARTWVDDGYMAYLIGLEGLNLAVQGNLAVINDEAATFEPAITYIEKHVAEVVYDGER